VIDRPADSCNARRRFGVCAWSPLAAAHCRPVRTNWRIAVAPSLRQRLQARARADRWHRGVIRRVHIDRTLAAAVLARHQRATPRRHMKSKGDHSALWMVLRQVRTGVADMAPPANLCLRRASLLRRGGVWQNIYKGRVDAEMSVCDPLFLTPLGWKLLNAPDKIVQSESLQIPTTTRPVSVPCFAKLSLLLVF
jgi:hypothetical protein